MILVYNSYQTLLKDEIEVLRKSINADQTSLYATLQNYNTLLDNQRKEQLEKN